MSAMVSIIVPCYNQGEYLDEAINSVLHQTYKDWECIIINDGSVDNTDAIAKKWLTKDKRIKYFNKPNEGVSIARNYGIKRSVGDYILPLDADDKIGKNYLNLAMNSFKDSPNLSLVYCKAEKFGVINKPWNLKPFSLRALARSNMIFCSAVFLKKDWKRVGGYDINMKKGLEDWEFWIAILKNGGEVKQLNSIEFFYRINEGSRNATIDSESLNDLLHYINKKHSNYILDNFEPVQLMEKELFISRQKRKNKWSRINLFVKTFFRNKSN